MIDNFSIQIYFIKTIASIRNVNPMRREFGDLQNLPKDLREILWSLNFLPMEFRQYKGWFCTLWFLVPMCHNFHDILMYPVSQPLHSTWVIRISCKVIFPRSSFRHRLRKHCTSIQLRRKRRKKKLNSLKE